MKTRTQSYTRKNQNKILLLILNILDFCHHLVSVTKRQLLLWVGLVLIGCFSLNQVQAQFVREPSTTRYIKDIYQYVQEKISRNQYYVNEFKLNATSLPWADAKSFQSTQQYFYSFVGDDSPVLRLVIVITKIAEKNYYTELLYGNDGTLVFVYEKQNDTQTYAYRELTAYFEKELCINLVVDKNILDAKKGLGEYAFKVKQLMETGKFYTQRFKKDMRDVKSDE